MNDANYQKLIILVFIMFSKLNRGTWVCIVVGTRNTLSYTLEITENLETMVGIGVIIPLNFFLTTEALFNVIVNLTFYVVT